MPRFKKYVITYGDTLQLIAEREMKDVSYWFDLATANNLKYPYIVDTPEEKAKDLNHLVTIGDTIIIPKESTLADINPDILSNHDKLSLEDIVLGNDLKVSSVDSDIEAHGAEDELLGLQGNGRGDIDLARGVNNVVQMIKLRLLTAKGSLILHPDYGSDLQKMIGKRNSSETADELNAIIEENLEQDSRVKSAKNDKYAYNDTYYYSVWTIELQDFDTYFKLIIQRDNDNNFIIDDTAGW